MSSSVINGAVCAAINQELTDISNGAAGEGKRDKVGFVDSLMSSVNTNGTEAVMIDKGNGKRGSVVVQYLPRQVASDVATTISDECTSTKEDAKRETEYDISLQVEELFRVDEDYISLICEGQSDWFRRVINNKFNALAVSVEDQLITTMAANFGINVTTGNALVRSVQILDGGNDDEILNANWLTFRDTELEDDNLFRGNPIIVGQGVFSRFNLLNKMACCNDRGQDVMELTAQAGYSFFKSQRTNSGLAANECIVYEPGSLQLLQFHKYIQRVANGITANPGAYFQYEVSDGEMRGLIQDPVTGLVYDMAMFKECRDRYTISMSLNFDLFVQPDDMYLAADPLSGANGTLYYRFTNA